MKLWMMILVAGLALGLAVGCGGGDGDDGESANGGETSAVTQTTQTATGETDVVVTETEGEPDTASSGGAGGAQSSERRTASTPTVDRMLFRLRRNVVVCGLERIAGRTWLSCFRTRTGYTIRLSLRGGLPRAGIVRKNRGIPRGISAVRVLRNGQRLNPSGFRCNVERAVVRCRNRANHGFQLGAVLSYRY